uniref:Uncharacterized protein n=1 Tax=Daphnia galeata TaxID=27404 RepID=A0A8J2WG64_9CRUS|nr:unnamed protein product [Daphnia galeata]
MASKSDQSELSNRMCVSCVENTLFEESEGLLICQKCGYLFDDNSAVLLSEELRPQKLLFVSLLNGFCGKFRFGEPLYTLVKKRKVNGVKHFWIGVTVNKLGMSALGKGKPKSEDSKLDAALKLLTRITQICQAGGPLTGVSLKKLEDCLDWIRNKS